MGCPKLTYNNYPTLRVLNGSDEYRFSNEEVLENTFLGAYRYGYQGQFAEADPETGLNSFELRMYDPAIGRWLSVDPKRQHASGYVGMGNNPESVIDPDGGKGSKSPIHDIETGEFLAYDSQGATGDILFTTKETYNKLSSNGTKVIDHNTAANSVDFKVINYVSPGAAEKALNDLALEYNKFHSDIKFDPSKLTSGKITLNGKLSVRAIGFARSGKLPNGDIEMIVPFAVSNQKTGYRFNPAITTIDDVWSLLVVHEFNGHIINNFTHEKIYKNQREHPTFNSLSNFYKNHLISPPGFNSNR